MNYTTDDLLRGIKRLAYLPDASDFTNADILEIADAEQMTIISDRIKAEREEHYVTYQDVTLVAGQTSYPIPRRAMGRVVRGVSLINANNIAFPCPTVDPVVGWYGLSQASTTSYVHSIVNDAIVFPAPPPAGYTMRVWYLRRPSKLVELSQGSAISVATTDSVQVFDETPLTWLPEDGNYIMDITKGDVPHECAYTDLLGYLASPFGVSFTDANLDPSIFPSNSYANESFWYLTMRETTVFPQIPVEFFPVLEAAVALRILVATGDPQAVELVTQTLLQRKQAAIDITSPRDLNGSRAIVRRSSPLRSGPGWARRRSLLR